MIRCRVMALIGALLVGACGRDEPAQTPTQSSAVAPAASKSLMALTLPDLAGAPQALGQWKGKILVVNYWATWCPPCKEEMPGFSRIHEKYAANGVQFVGISIDSVDKVKKFQAETPVRYPLLLGEMDTMRTAVDMGNASQGLPFTVIIDRQGDVYSTKLGRFQESVLEERLLTLLKQ